MPSKTWWTGSKTLTSGKLNECTLLFLFTDFAINFCYVLPLCKLIVHNARHLCWSTSLEYHSMSVAFGLVRKKCLIEFEEVHRKGK